MTTAKVPMIFERTQSWFAKEAIEARVILDDLNVKPFTSAGSGRAPLKLRQGAKSQPVVAATTSTQARS